MSAGSFCPSPSRVAIHSPRAARTPVLMAAALERSGVLDLDGVDADAVRRTGELVLLGGGKPVGEIRAAF